MNIMIKLLDPRLDTTIPIPAYQTECSAGLDLRCMTQEYITLFPGDRFMVPSGIAIYTGHPDVMALLAIRSSIGLKGLVLQNSIGIIDADYQGPIMIALANIGPNPVRIEAGERIAQLIFLEIKRASSLSIVKEFPATKRGVNGWGSTGNL